MTTENWSERSGRLPEAAILSQTERPLTTCASAASWSDSGYTAAAGGNVDYSNYNDYFYARTANGEIRIIYDEYGCVAARYSYDAWGRITGIDEEYSSCIGALNSIRYKDYYYDTESGFYYLQSRYYDPSVCRFISADSVDYIGVSETTFGINLFYYCDNNAIQNEDPEGHTVVRFVGFGFQIDISIKYGSFGIEVVWFTESFVRGNRKWYEPYIYFYCGFGASLSFDYSKILKRLCSNASLLSNPTKLLSGISGSISVFAIFGYNNFTKPTDYSGYFVGYSLTIRHIKAYTAIGNTCFAIGLGYSSSFMSSDHSITRYWLLDDIISFLSGLYNVIFNRAKSIKA